MVTAGLGAETSRHPLQLAAWRQDHCAGETLFQRPDVEQIQPIQVGLHGNLLHHGRADLESRSLFRILPQLPLLPRRQTRFRAVRRRFAPPMVLRIPGDYGAPQVDVIPHRIDLVRGLVHEFQLQDFMRVFHRFAQSAQLDLVAEADGGNRPSRVAVPGGTPRTGHRVEHDRRQEHGAGADQGQPGKQLDDHSRSARTRRHTAEVRLHGSQRPAGG